jgi:hypothetical protein
MQHFCPHAVHYSKYNVRPILRWIYMNAERDNLHETPEFGHRAKLAWIKAKRGAGGGT